MRRTWWTGLLIVALVAAVGPASAAPNEDNQPSTAPSRYAAAAPTGWMTSAASDRVHDIAQVGNTVYVAGTFAGIRPTRTGPVTARTNIAAFDATTGEPRGFAPAVNGAVYSLEPSPDGSRLYLGGAFTTVNGVAHNRIVALDPTSGAVVTAFSPNLGGGSVRSIVLRSGILYAGGNFTSASGQSRIGLAAFDTTGAGVPLASWAPSATGTGGVLTLEASPDGSRLYVGGRFTAVNGQPSTAFLAALHRTTAQVDPSFAAQPGREVFDVLADDDGRVWAALGGVLGRADVYRAADGSLLTRHETSGDVESVEQVGDLVYFGGHDIGPSEFEHIGVVDPAAPAILDAASFDEPSTGGDGIWAIHSTGRDLWVGGNMSGPYFGFTRHPAVADPPDRVELLPVLSSWRYLDTAAAPAAWRAAGFDDSAWPTGGAELGFGDGGEGTLLRSGRGTYYFRRTVDVNGVAGLRDLRLDLLVDDGAAVYVNGTEAVRTNLPAGTLNDGSRAVLGLAGNAEDTFQSFTVPTSALVEGANTVAVEVHQNSSASSDLSFDLRLSAVRDVVDTTPPSVPTGLASPARTATTVDVTWTASTDDRAVARYEVFVDGTSAGTTTARTFTVTGLAPSSTHAVTVEALDAAGNRSGRSTPLSVTTSAATPGTVQVVARGATWRYRDIGPAPATAWAQPSFDDSAWLQGPAILGREEGDEATVLAPGAGARWFRRTFPIADAGSVTALRLELVADDGAVVYLNGTEVVRDNLPAGTLTAATLAASYRTGAAERAVRTFTLPTAALVTGTNVLAVQLHQASGSPDASFDASLAATGAVADTTAPSVPGGLTSPARSSTSIGLSWNAATDDVAVARYEVFRNGTSAGTTTGTTFTVTGLSPSTAYDLAVEAIDAAGNRSARSPAISVSTTAAAAGPVTYIARGDTWRWWNAVAAPPSTWAQQTYDDTAWPTGAAELGAGDGDEVTVLPAGYGTRWFRRAFTVTGAAGVGALEVEILADDGAVVYLNGVELVRDNVAAGPVTADTLATDYRFGVAETQRHTYTVPATALVDGSNVLAVSLHQAWGSPDVSFDLRLRSA